MYQSKSSLTQVIRYKGSLTIQHICVQVKHLCLLIDNQSHWLCQLVVRGLNTIELEQSFLLFNKKSKQIKYFFFVSFLSSPVLQN